MSRRSASPPFVPSSSRPEEGASPAPEDGNREKISVESGEQSYLLGKGGATKMRLQNFSGADIVIDTSIDYVNFECPPRKLLASLS